MEIMWIRSFGCLKFAKNAASTMSCQNSNPRLLRAVLLVFLLGVVPKFVLSQTVPAQSQDVIVTAELDHAQITFGDPVTLTVTARSLQSVQVVSLEAQPDLNYFEVRKKDSFKRTEDGLKVSGEKIVFTAFGLGDYVLDPAHVDYRDKTGQIKSVSSNKLYLSVLQVKTTSADKDIRGVKDVVSIPRRYKRPLIIGGSALVFFIVSGLLIYRRLKSATPGPLEVFSSVTAEQDALFQLNSLFDSTLIRQGQYREYFFKFSEILRSYLEKRFLILAVESTTDEILDVLRDKETPHGFLNSVRETLEAADLAKFAKWKPDPSEILQLNQKARKLVGMAAPRGSAHGV